MAKRRKNYTGRKHHRVLPFIVIILLAGALAFFAYSAVSHFLAPAEIPITDSGTEPSAPDNPPEPEPEESIPAEWLDNGIFSAQYEQAYQILSEMTLEEKVGQVLLARCPEENAAEMVSQYHLGGYVLFNRDFKGLKKSTVIKNIQSYQDASPEIPLIIAVDEEGGSVVRLSSNTNLSKKPFNSQRYIYSNGGISALEKDTATKVELLASLGINVNLAPVADVSTNSKDYIYKRTIGKNATTTAKCISAIISKMQGSGVAATLKHFPGYGNNPDTHTGVAVDKRSLASFRESDFLPFQAGIEAGAECVLVSHNIVNAMDPDYPSSLSPKVHDILRDELNFTGLIMTDDMAMDAIQEYAGDSDPYVLAIKAGNNLITTSDIETPYRTLLTAVKSGDLTEEELDKAVFKVLAFKLSLLDWK